MTTFYPPTVMPLTSISPIPYLHSSFTPSPLLSSIHPQSLSTLCSWWESTHSTLPLPHMCHQYTSPDKLVTGYVAPPRQYNFARVASDMFQASNHDSVERDMMPVSVPHAAHGAGRTISLIGISLGVLFILFIITFITCIKRRKNMMTHLHRDSRNTQVVFTLETFNTDRRKDFPPDYNSVVRMREEEGLPSYSQAVSGNFSVQVISESKVDTTGNIVTNEESDNNADSDNMEEKDSSVDGDR